MSEQPPPPGGTVDPAWAPPPSPEATSPRQPADVAAIIKDVCWTLGIYVVLGVLAGLLWSRLGQDAQVYRYPDLVGQDEVQLAKVFSTDAWFVIIGGVTSLVAGLVLGFWRTRDVLLTVILAVAGCIVAAFLMKATGQAWGPADPRGALKHAAVGTHFADAVRLHSDAALLVWPAGTLAGLLVSLLTRPE